MVQFSYVKKTVYLHYVISIVCFLIESKEIEDMRVVASEEIPEISRKDLIGIIQKSQFFQ